MTARVNVAPMIAVRDVIASGRWYQQLLDCQNEHPDHPEFAKLVNALGDTILLLHSWDTAEPADPMDRWFVNPDPAHLGHGLLLTFVLDDFEGAIERVGGMDCDVIEDLHVLPSRNQAFWVRDPDGYAVQLTSSYMIAPEADGHGIPHGFA